MRARLYTLSLGVRSRRLFVWSALSLGAISFSSVSHAATTIAETVEAYFKRRDQLDSTYREYRSEMSVSVRSDIRKHYDGIKETYLFQPYKLMVADADSALADAIKLKQIVSTALDAAKNKFDGTPEAKAAFNSCLNSDESPLSTFRKFSPRNNTMTFSKMGSALEAGESLTPSAVGFLQSIASSQTIAKEDLEGSIKACCDSSRVDSQKVDCQKIAEDSASKMQPLLNQLARIQLVPPVIPPNPLQDTSLRPTMVGELLKSHGTEIKRPRNDSALSLRAKAESEEDAFANLEADCKKSQQKKQDRTTPFKDSVWNPIAKALKCSVLPTLTTLYAETTVQKISLAVAGAQIEDKAAGWDVNCDPGTIEAFDAMRPTDPNVVAQQWGLPQLANPPWIQNMRTLPMLGSPFSVTPVPGGGYMTPYGGIALPETGQTSASSSTSQSAGSKARRDRATGSRVASRMRTSSRRLSQSSQATRAVRGLSDNVSRGRAVDESLASLRSGTSNTRTLAGNLVAKNKKRGLSNVAKDRTLSAAKMRTTVRNLAGSKASRTTSESVLGSLRGRSRGTPTGPTFSDMRKQTEAERRRIEMLVEKYVENIETARRKSEEARVKMFQKIADHDLATTKVMEKLADKPPKKQAKIMMDLRTELNLITRELAEYKSQYDVYQAAIMEQAMLIKNLAAFGVKAPNFPGYGGQNDPNKMPSSYPQVGNGSGGRGAVVPGTNSTSLESLEKIFKYLESTLKPSLAWAAAENVGSRLGIFNNEKDWWAAWNKHTADYEIYVNSRAKEEKTYVAEAARVIESRYNGVSLDNPVDDDVETLLTMYDFSDIASKESRELIVASEARKNSLTGNHVATLRKIEIEARESMENIETVFLQSLETYTKNSDDNPTPYEELILSYLVE